MNLLLTVRVALRALSKNKLRGLTVLGVVIGIAAVTTMVSIGQGASELVQGQFQALGTNLIVVFPGSRNNQGVQQGRGTSHTLTADDCEAMAGVPCGAGRLAHRRSYGPGHLRQHELDSQGTDRGRDRLLDRAKLADAAGGLLHRAGDFFGRQGLRDRQDDRRKLFQTSNPIGEMIRIRNIPFEVIGVLETKGANMIGEDQDNLIIAPYTTIRKRLQGSNFENVNVILASARANDRMSEAENQIRQLLCERHRVLPR